MSTSIYYTGLRDKPLMRGEREAIDALIAKYRVQDQIERYARTGEGPNWSSFGVYDSDRTEPGTIFEGAMVLPDNSEEAAWRGMQHWCGLLAEIRRVLPNTAWRVHVDDYDIAWDEEQQSYDLTV